VDTARRPLTDAFVKKYPFIKVDVFRASNEELVPRMLEEFKANRNTFDVLETTSDSLDPLISTGVMQAYKSPEFAAYPPGSLDPKGFFAPVRESYVGLGYNTRLLTRAEVPKQLDDLMDPRWKGQMAIAGSSTGVRFVGNVLLTKGDAFLKQLGAQDIRVQKISGRALADLVIAGEVPLSPTIFDSHVAASKQQNAPIDWVPLEPTVVNLGVAAVAAKGPHPNAALLFADFLLSQDGQKIYMDYGYGSARNGMGSTVTEFKKRYLENDVPDYLDAFDKWQKLMTATFVQV
jgi:iron(III) transport system substrate-binding protein